MSLFIQWEEQYSIGIELMDEHHQQLVALINELYSGVFACEDIEEERRLTKTILAQLAAYVDYHFTAEEQLLLEQQFPDYNEHLAAHNRFRQELNNLSEQVALGGLALSFPIFEFMRDWLTNHILIADKKYSVWILEQGIATP